MKISWKNKKDKLKQKFSSIRERDLKYRIGKEWKMIRKLRDRLGKTEEEILGIIVDL